MKKHILSTVPLFLLGLMIQYQLSWEKLFTEQLLVEFLLLSLVCTIGYGVGRLLPQNRLLFYISISVSLGIWFYGQSALLWLITLSNYGWNLILLIALLTGMSIANINSHRFFKLNQLLGLGAGLIVGYFNWWYLTIAFVVAFIIWLLATDRVKIGGKSVAIGMLILMPQIVVPPRTYSSQRKYIDKVVYSGQTRVSKVDITQWRNGHWLYVNSQNKINSTDEWLHHEPMVHPLMNLTKAKRVLLLGGETGGALRELLKYSSIQTLDVVPYDKELHSIIFHRDAFGHTFLPSNQLHIHEASVFKFLETTDSTYDAIIIDLPDPTNLEFNQYYTKEFYILCKEQLAPNGAIITQAGSPYFATKAFYAIGKTMQSAGFKVVPLHNQILTLGEWGWFVGSTTHSVEAMKDQIAQTSSVDTRWFNREAGLLMTSFGKVTQDTSEMQVNTITNPVIFKYYNSGNWLFQ